MRNRLRIFPLGSEGGSAGQTQLDLLLDGVTLYPSFAQDDYRPAWPFVAADLIVQGRIHELTERHPRPGGGLSPLQEAVMLVNLSLSPGYRLKITRASRMSELADRAITIAVLGGSAAFLEILRRWLQRRQDKRQEQLQLDVWILEEGHALRQHVYQLEREALQALAEERERRHKAELPALEAQMQAKLEALTRLNDDLTRHLAHANACRRGKGVS